jgi:endonuclease VIII
MRMHGSWHIYRPGERWQRPRHDMRIVLATAEFEAVAFSVPVAEFLSTDDLARQRDLREMGPDLLGDTFNPADAVTRIAQRPEIAIADALLDQRAIAGIGNVYKSEVLFACRVNPFTLVRDLEPGAIERLVTTAEKLLRANIEDATGGGIVTYAGRRRTTGRADPSARLWVYGRAGKPCRRCGTPVSRAKQGAHARSTYWCSRCQLPTPNTRSEPTPNP